MIPCLGRVTLAEFGLILMQMMSGLDRMWMKLITLSQRLKPTTEQRFLARHEMRVTFDIQRWQPKPGIVQNNEEFTGGTTAGWVEHIYFSEVLNSTCSGCRRYEKSLFTNMQLLHCFHGSPYNRGSIRSSWFRIKNIFNFVFFPAEPTFLDHKLHDFQPKKNFYEL